MESGSTGHWKELAESEQPSQKLLRTGAGRARPWEFHPPSHSTASSTQISILTQRSTVGDCPDAGPSVPVSKAGMREPAGN